MSTKEKLIERFKQQPNDFTFDELRKLLFIYGYCETNKGRTSGSRVAFYHDTLPPILLHKPHPNNTVKQYAMKQLLDFLSSNKLI